MMRVREMMAATAVFLSLAFPSLVVPSDGVSAGEGAVAAEDWARYEASFLDASGRIVDNGNGGISHSEGQGYGLLLAYLAGDRAGFELIWRFTLDQLLLRDDGLAIWKWDPDARPHTPDANNASDGDILIAYALALAGRDWRRADYLARATRMARSLLDECVIRHDGRTLLMPAVSGFSAEERAGAPVINLSYWIFPAFPVLAALVPDPRWGELADSGREMIASAAFGVRKLPADWTAAASVPAPAPGFPAEFGYNAVRIPLYLIGGGVEDRALLAHLRAAMTDGGDTPEIVDLASGRALRSLDDPGYAIIIDMMACALDGTPLPERSRRFQPTLYYPASLQLLGLSILRKEHPKCL